MLALKDTVAVSPARERWRPYSMFLLLTAQGRSVADHMATMIVVYADWHGLPEPLRPERLHANRTKGREVFEFEFDTAALGSPALIEVQLDPRLGLYEGRQYSAQGSDTFEDRPSEDRPSFGTLSASP
jgi:hypothetical protein